MQAAPADFLVPPRIDSVPKEGYRPFWSVMIPTYNCVEYLGETLRSVLCQDPGPEYMQIEVIDDCSTKDDPEVLLREIGQGRVGFFRQPQNVGAVGNYNTCIRRSFGEWVHILHGDDSVRPGFYERARQGVTAHPDADAAVCRVIHMDEGGQWMSFAELEARAPGVLGDDFVARLLLVQRIQFAGIVVRRAAYEELGGFRPELVHCADWDMWKRIALRKRIFYDPQPLACYRVHAGADTARLMKTGENVVDERRAIRLSCAYVPQKQAKRIYRDAMKAAAIRAISGAQRLWRSGHRTIALRQLREATRCSLAPVVLVRLVHLFVWVIAR